MNIPRLHVITDQAMQCRHDHATLARLALEGGADAVQFREKRPWKTAALVRVAAQIVGVCRRANALAVVNDRADVAVATGATAVHLGRDDLDPATARRILGSDAVIGGTANSYAQAATAWATEVDYLGVGPIHGTQSKDNSAPAMGLATLAQIVRDCPKPIVAIGGISAARIGDVIRAGAHGVAVLSTVVAAEDPAAATLACRLALDAALDQA